MWDYYALEYRSVIVPFGPDDNGIIPVFRKYIGGNGDFTGGDSVLIRSQITAVHADGGDASAPGFIIGKGDFYRITDIVVSDISV